MEGCGRKGATETETKEKATEGEVSRRERGTRGERREIGMEKELEREREREKE